MCDLKRKSRRKEITGWKVVAVHDKTGEYYSSAMGFKYPEGRIPVIKVQTRLYDGWARWILDEETACFSKNMRGRTTVFIRLRDAKGLLRGSMDGMIDEYYFLKVIKATISEDIMLGIYEGVPIAAGRRIRFLE